MAELRGRSNARLAVTAAVLIPATGITFAFTLHHWDHQPWWAVIPAGAVFALGTGAVRWWHDRR